MHAVIVHAICAKAKPILFSACHYAISIRKIEHHRRIDFRRPAGLVHYPSGVFSQQNMYKKQ